MNCEMLWFLTIFFFYLVRSASPDHARFSSYNQKKYVFYYIILYYIKNYINENKIDLPSFCITK